MSSFSPGDSLGLVMEDSDHREGRGKATHANAASSDATFRWEVRCEPARGVVSVASMARSTKAERGIPGALRGRRRRRSSRICLVQIHVFLSPGFRQCRSGRAPRSAFRLPTRSLSWFRSDEADVDFQNEGRLNRQLEQSSDDIRRAAAAGPSYVASIYEPRSVTPERSSSTTVTLTAKVGTANTPSSEDQGDDNG